MQDSHCNDNCKESTALSQPNPDREDSWLQKGVSLIFTNQFDQAIALFRKKMHQAKGRKKQTARIQRAEAFFLLGVCYEVMFCQDQSEKYFKKSREAVRLAYPEDESLFRFHPLCWWPESDFNEAASADDSLQSSLTHFIEQNGDSPLSHLGRMVRLEAFFELKLPQDEDLCRLTRLYPKSVVAYKAAILTDMLGTLHDNISTKVLLNLIKIKELVPKSSYILDFEGTCCHKVDLPCYAFKAWFESLAVKSSRRSSTYVGMLEIAWRCGNLKKGIFFDFFEQNVKDAPEIILEAVRNVLKDLFGGKNLSSEEMIYDKSNKTLLSTLRYGGLCSLELGLFEEAITYFQQIADAVFDSQSLKKAGPKMETLFEELKAECREKIEQCKIPRIRAARKIYRSLLEAMYRPGGPGYYAAEEHFNMLKAQQ